MAPASAGRRREVGDMLLRGIVRAEDGNLRAYGVYGIELREDAERGRAQLPRDEESGGGATATVTASAA